MGKTEKNHIKTGVCNVKKRGKKTSKTCIYVYLLNIDLFQEGTIHQVTGNFHLFRGATRPSTSPTRELGLYRSPHCFIPNRFAAITPSLPL